MTTAELERALLAFVNQELLGGRDHATVTDRLFEDGYVDSVRVLELVSFLERTVGRPIPDRSIRLANFRSVRAIARAFGGDGAPSSDDAGGTRFRYHTVPERFASPVEELRRRGELTDVDGGWRLNGLAGRLFDYFDGTFAAWTREIGGGPAVDAPDTMATATLERAGFLADFPQLVVAGHAPAACYHVYESLSDAPLPRTPLVLGIRARCRRAETAPRPLERCVEFTMREVVVLGTPPDVDRVRRRLLRRVDRFVTALSLDGAVVPATDPFFTSEATGRALAQKAGELKLELRLTLEEHRDVAVASFNRHHAWFGRRFGIALPDGSPAHSGCIAFGVERWVLAYLTQHGFDEHTWPASVRSALAIRRAHAARS